MAVSIQIEVETEIKIKTEAEVKIKTEAEVKIWIDSKSNQADPKLGLDWFEIRSRPIRREEGKSPTCPTSARPKPPMRDLRERARKKEKETREEKAYKTKRKRGILFFPSSLILLLSIAEKNKEEMKRGKGDGKKEKRNDRLQASPPSMHHIFVPRWPVTGRAPYARMPPRWPVSSCAPCARMPNQGSA